MIRTTHLFLPLNKKLVELLRSLNADDWNKPTLAKLWTVKDIAAHILDTHIRTISLARDKHVLIPDRQINSYESLVDYLNRLNADWVAAAKRISPPVLIELLELTGEQGAAYFETVDLMADATFSVAWAGEEKSTNWFHIARELTEKWHHQQQIRDAVGKPGIMTREFFHPVIATFLRGLPHTYRNTIAPEGTSVKITIAREIGGDWYLVRNHERWELTDKPATTHAATITIPPDVAWKLFTKGITRQEAEKTVTITGDQQLAGVTLTLLAVMA